MPTMPGTPFLHALAIQTFSRRIKYEGCPGFLFFLFFLTLLNSLSVSTSDHSVTQPVQSVGFSKSECLS